MRKNLVGLAVMLWAAALGTGGFVALQELTDKEPPSVTINYDAPVPDMNPPTQLHVQNVTKAECDDLGGTYDAKVFLCKNVSY